MKNLTPKALRCGPIHCPSVHQLEDGSLLIVGRIAEPHEMAGSDIDRGGNEEAIIIAPALLDDVPRGWRTIDSLDIADKHGEILALSPDHCDGKRPLILRWFKYNGLLAWRDWDNEAHRPTHWQPLPLHPTDRERAGE